MLNGAESVIAAAKAEAPKLPAPGGVIEVVDDGEPDGAGTLPHPAQCSRNSPLGADTEPRVAASFDGGERKAENMSGIDGTPETLASGATDVDQEPVEIECEEVWRQISAYLDDELDPKLRATLAAHFKNCAHCSAVLDGARNVVKLVGDGRAFEILSTTSKRLYDKLNAYLAEQRGKNR